MKTATELHYLQHPVGAQLLPYLAQRPYLRRHAALVNLPRLADLFGRGRVPTNATQETHVLSGR